ncbi:hypothetical protein RN22_02130 [Grimontia sp. AD028]|uniref:hypothetical protein n=1 Tax=Grimontia sp. AD028 TaxID=1581149 RepID=UPI00061AE8D9|nr:hypothetical protein [Grimontia sp. AD028]KKD62139.1 hypothetical protein RN22_02130 [Grimontia sp. AD028]
MAEQLPKQEREPEQGPKTISEHASGSIHSDPFIRSFLERTPKDVAESFTDAQLLQLKLMFGTRAKARHAIDFRTVIGGFGWNYYLVFLFGRNRRELTRAEEKAANAGRVLVLLLSSFVLFSIVITSLYLLKSFLGIDLLPNFSLGLWSWLNS